MAEALQNMENNMAMQNNMAGNSNCSKPGGGKQTAKSLSELQKQLNEQIKKLKNAKGKSGTGKDRSGKRMSEQIARMAAEQEIIRSQLQKYLSELKAEGIDAQGLNDVVKDMEMTEREIINKMINQETIERQERILTRLLQSEKADMEREKKKTRESIEAKEYKISNPKENFEYKEKDYMERELLRRINPKLREYYRQKVQEYFNKFYLRDEKESN